MKECLNCGNTTNTMFCVHFYENDFYIDYFDELEAQDDDPKKDYEGFMGV